MQITRTNLTQITLDTLTLMVAHLSGVVSYLGKLPFLMAVFFVDEKCSDTTISEVWRKHPFQIMLRSISNLEHRENINSIVQKYRYLDYGENINAIIPKYSCERISSKKNYHTRLWLQTPSVFSITDTV